jgi:FMN phosphatase YigB (HAD superfamily)
MSELIIFDLDGTIMTEMKFYKEVYSGTLNRVVESERGMEGLRILDECRINYGGRGELALFALGIPFEKWANLLIEAPLDLIKKDPLVVDAVRKINASKVIYTGSPREMAVRILARVGFLENDFDFIVGWEKPEFFPLKWSCSPMIFSKIIRDMGGNFSEVWSVGDTWETDLEPAKSIGIKTVMVGKTSCLPDICYPTLAEFVRGLS